MRLQFQLLFFVEKPILYAKMTLSQKKFPPKLSFKQSTGFFIVTAYTVIVLRKPPSFNYNGY